MADHGLPRLDLPSRKDGSHGGGNGTKHGWKVEVRTTYLEPATIGDFTIDNVWREYSIRIGAQKWATNIPVREWDADMLQNSGLVTYEVAEAHRWSLIAMLQAHRAAGALCVETRLVKVEYTYSYSAKEIGVSEPLSYSYGLATTERFPSIPAAGKTAAA